MKYKLAELYLSLLRKLRTFKCLKRWEVQLWNHSLAVITLVYGEQSKLGLWELD